MPEQINFEEAKNWANGMLKNALPNGSVGSAENAAKAMLALAEKNKNIEIEVRRACKEITEKACDNLEETIGYVDSMREIYKGEMEILEAENAALREMITFVRDNYLSGNPTAIEKIKAILTKDSGAKALERWKLAEAVCKSISVPDRHPKSPRSIINSAFNWKSYDKWATLYFHDVPSEQASRRVQS